MSAEVCLLFLCGWLPPEDSGQRVGSRDGIRHCVSTVLRCKGSVQVTGRHSGLEPLPLLSWCGDCLLWYLSLNLGERNSHLPSDSLLTVSIDVSTFGQHLLLVKTALTITQNRPPSLSPLCLVSLKSFTPVHVFGFSSVLGEGILNCIWLTLCEMVRGLTVS